MKKEVINFVHPKNLHYLSFKFRDFAHLIYINGKTVKLLRNIK